MALFSKKREPKLPYDPARQQPAVRRSICTGELTGGFIDRETGRFHEAVLVRSIEEFRRMTGADDITTIY